MRLQALALTALVAVLAVQCVSAARPRQTSSPGPVEMSSMVITFYNSGAWRCAPCCGGQRGRTRGRFAAATTPASALPARTLRARLVQLISCRCAFSARGVQQHGRRQLVADVLPAPPSHCCSTPAEYQPMYSPLSQCELLLRRAAKHGGKRIQFVPTHYW